jgi:SpoVK/Ycf46/Vps4 family AAA+-type ATPase
LRRRFDDPDRAPAGITVVGPNGAGKTFILEAFAAETERTVITLSQIRSEWYGKTDVFAEMFERGISAFGRIMVLVDEAHVAFGSIHSRDTHETEARLTRHIIQMIDDLGHRSKIVWALITTRPDLLDPDFVRSGRCSVFVPIFDPEGEDLTDFAAMVERRLVKAGVTLSPEEHALFVEKSKGFSAGDFREFSDDFADERAFDPERRLADFLEGWTPSSVSLARERELQILLAALNCDWPELLPERLKAVPKDEIRARIDALKARFI